MNPRTPVWHRWYRLAGLVLSIAFAVVGVMFLAIPDDVLAIFGELPIAGKAGDAARDGVHFFRVLAVAYMALVTFAAFMMFQRPQDDAYPFMLVIGKTASALVSILFFLAFGMHTIYLANAVTDGSIAVMVYVLRTKARGTST